MNKQHILGFFDTLVRTPAFLFLCAMFLCGALAGGLTGLHAGEGDSAIGLTTLLAALPGQVLKSVLCAVLWLVLPLVCALLRPVPLCLSALTAARGLRARADRGGRHRAGGGSPAFAVLRRAARSAQCVRASGRLCHGLAEPRGCGPVCPARLPHPLPAVRGAGRAERTAPRRYGGAVEPVTKAGQSRPAFLIPQNRGSPRAALRIP